jgi:hypothetical protein
MEHILINELIRLLCKGGCESFVGNFQRDLDSDGNSMHWNKDEIEEAIHYLKYINEYFGKEEARAMVTSLIVKYNININEISVTKVSAESLGLGATRP